MIDNPEHTVEDLHPGDEVTIENTGDSALSIAIVTGASARMEMELTGRQSIKFGAGTGEARILLIHGDPDKLLIVKPETP